MVTLPALKQYRLVGGTALSLLYGHRKSIDFDFFTDQPHDLAALLPVLEENFGSISQQMKDLKPYINAKFKM